MSMKDIIICILSAFAFSATLTALLLPLLKKLKAGQYVLGYVKEHKNKTGTPTMGGLVFVVVIGVIAVFFCGFENATVNLTLAVTVSFGVVGFLDDFIKIYRKDNQGLKAYQKIIFQTAIAIIAGVFCYIKGITYVNIPFMPNYALELGWGMIPFVIFVFLATVNCVNLTDGLDGLASGTSLSYLFFMGIILFLVGRTSSWVCFAAVGALGGFLLFNINRASVFMGDTGSLALGGLIASVSIFSGNALYIPLLGVTFVISGISVIIQVIYYKRTRRRVFLMAPLHHHLQMKGLSEGKISYLYFIVTSLVGALCLLFV